MSEHLAPNLVMCSTCAKGIELPPLVCWMWLPTMYCSPECLAIAEKDWEQIRES